MSVSYRPFEGSQSVFVLQFQTVENGGEERGKTTVGLDEMGNLFWGKIFRYVEDEFIWETK